MPTETPTWSIPENDNLCIENFPTDFYLDVVVRFLKIMKYDDKNYCTREERVRNLHYVYTKTAQHFAQPKQQKLIKARPKALQAGIQTVVAMVVSCWPRMDPDNMAELAIHFNYTLLLDDSTDQPEKTMETFYNDLVAGRPQQHSWWQMVNESLPLLLQYYGPYCQLNIVRSTVDFFQGCWIEQYNFHGYPGAHNYPNYLRRLNGLGQNVGAALFTKEHFDEKSQFREITSAIAHAENWTMFINDLLSFFKEWDEPRGQISLVKNYATCDRSTMVEALEKLAKDCISTAEQIVEVYADKDESVRDALMKFCHGYITWHLSDPRYRLGDLTAKVSGSKNTTAKEFCRYQQSGARIGGVNSQEWAYPSVVELVERNNAKRDSMHAGYLVSTPQWLEQP